MRDVEGRDSVDEVRREVPAGGDCFCHTRRGGIGADTPVLCPHDDMTRVNNAHRDVGGRRSLIVTYIGLNRDQHRTSRCCRSCYLPGARCSGLHGTG